MAPRKPSKKKIKTGRPTKFKDEYCEQGRKLCLLGAKDSEIAIFFNVAESTLNKWKLDYPLFSEALRAGKDDADAEIAESLYKTALSGNTTAQIFWLKNRRSKEWRDKQEIRVEGLSSVYDVVPLTRKKVSDDSSQA